MNDKELPVAKESHQQTSSNPQIRSQRVMQIAAFSSPIPDPDTLDRYDEKTRDAIRKSFLLEQECRHKKDFRAFVVTLSSHVVSVILGLGAFVAAVYCAKAGAYWAAAAIGSSGIAAIIGKVIGEVRGKH